MAIDSVGTCLVGLLLAVVVSGCPLAHDDVTPYDCYSDEDCFSREGEYCDRAPSAGSGEPGVCRLQIDAALPDARIGDSRRSDLPPACNDGCPDGAGQDLDVGATDLDLDLEMGSMDLDGGHDE